MYKLIQYKWNSATKKHEFVKEKVFNDYDLVESALDDGGEFEKWDSPYSVEQHILDENGLTLEVSDI